MRGCLSPLGILVEARERVTECPLGQLGKCPEVHAAHADVGAMGQQSTALLMVRELAGHLGQRAAIEGILEQHAVDGLGGVAHQDLDGLDPHSDAREERGVGGSNGYGAALCSIEAP